LDDCSTVMGGGARRSFSLRTGCWAMVLYGKRGCAVTILLRISSVARLLSAPPPAGGAARRALARRRGRRPGRYHPSYQAPAPLCSCPLPLS
jgi:hypothetical protein